jgi:hypothetical protein
VLLCALAILPGMLGILMLTNKIAADAAGARLIYQHLMSVLLVSVVLILFASYQAFSSASPGWLLSACLFGFACVCIFGFLMHTRLLFKPIRVPFFISIEEAIPHYNKIF